MFSNLLLTDHVLRWVEQGLYTNDTGEFWRLGTYPPSQRRRATCHTAQLEVEGSGCSHPFMIING